MGGKPCQESIDWLMFFALFFSLGLGKVGTFSLTDFLLRIKVPIDPR